MFEGIVCADTNDGDERIVCADINDDVERIVCADTNDGGTNDGGNEGMMLPHVELRGVVTESGCFFM